MEDYVLISERIREAISECVELLASHGLTNDEAVLVCYCTANILEARNDER